MLHYLPYVFLFMVATMLIYGWGLWRASRQTNDLMNMLYSKSVSKVKKAIKRNGPMTKKEIEDTIKDIQVSQPFSKNRLGITDPKSFSLSLIEYMIKQKIIIEEKGKKNKSIYKLK
nr:hypothetical protein [Anaerofustis sp.]